jgi:hypothetical protein
MRARAKRMAVHRLPVRLALSVPPYNETRRLT